MQSNKGYDPIVKKINFTTGKLLLKVCNYNMCLGNMTQAANKLLKGGHLHLRADRPDPAQPSPPQRGRSGRCAWISQPAHRPCDFYDSIKEGDNSISTTT